MNGMIPTVTRATFMKARMMRLTLAMLAVSLLLDGRIDAQGRAGRQGGPATAPTTAQAQAPIDLTGNWVAVISEDWRWRMITPAKGDYASIPMTAEGMKVADTWDPAKDEAAGEQCRSYGAPGLMRTPTRLRISWSDATTLKVETDYGMQARLFHFGRATPPAGPPTWQGDSVATWEMPRGRGAANAPKTGSLKVATKRLRPGYLRKNGVPYSANAELTEFWDLAVQPDGTSWIVITSIVHDPRYLLLPFTTALHFKKEADGAKWDPTPCSARW
ncbi:MAG: hypothetical protein ABMA15_08470 [Vicinamibacterales bacterium]